MTHLSLITAENDTQSNDDELSHHKNWLLVVTGRETINQDWLMASTDFVVYHVNLH